MLQLSPGRTIHAALRHLIPASSQDLGLGFTAGCGGLKWGSEPRGRIHGAGSQQQVGEPRKPESDHEAYKSHPSEPASPQYLDTP